MSLLIGTLAVVSGYLLGSIPSAYMIGRLKGIDLTLEDNDGNLGTSLSFHRLGVVSGLVVGLVDLAKGIITVAFAQALGVPPTFVLVAGVAAVTGHDWSIFAGFKGGRGTMVSYGVLASLALWGLIFALALGGICLFFTHKSTLSTVVLLSILSIMLLIQSSVRFLPSLPWEPEITPWIVIFPLALLIPSFLKLVQIREKEYLVERRHAPIARS